MTDLGLGELMTHATDHAPPSRRIDLARARAEGARRLRRRRALTSAVAAVTTAGLLTGGVAATRALGPALTGPSAQAAAGGPTPGGTVPDRFEPLRLRVSPGWLPEDVPDRIIDTAGTYQRVTFAGSDSAPADGARRTARQIDVAVYARGVTPTLPASAPNGPGPSVSAAPSGRGPSDGGPSDGGPSDGGPSDSGPSDSGPSDSGPSGGTLPATIFASGESGPPIGGQDSYVLADQNTIAWKWAPGAWATVTVHGSGLPGPQRDVAIRVATTLNTVADQPITMPFTVAGPPAPLQLVGTRVVHSGRTYETVLHFDDPRDPTDSELNIGVRTNASRTGDGKYGHPSTSYDGHPAVVDFDGGYAHVELFDVAAHQVSVGVQPTARRYVDRQTAVALARGVQLVPSPAQVSNWTATPVR